VDFSSSDAPMYMKNAMSMNQKPPEVTVKNPKMPINIENILPHMQLYELHSGKTSCLQVLLLVLFRHPLEMQDQVEYAKNNINISIIPIILR